MLLLAGVLSLVLGGVLIVVSRIIFSHNLLSAGFRRFLGGETASVALATLMGSGLVMILLFMADFDANGLALLPGTLVMALGMGGILAIRLFHRRYGLAEDEEGGAAPAVAGVTGGIPSAPAAADPPKRAA